MQDSPGAEEKSSAPFLLSPRQAQCLTLMAHGATAREIALRLNISPLTVREHLFRARAKLGARSMCHAVALAVASGECRLARCSESWNE